MRPLKLGITGGIGSGKSVVCRIFKEIGIPVYDADQEAKILLKSDPEIVSAVKQLIGKEAYDPSGSPNRAFISSVVFSSPEKLEALNNIIHPAVRKNFLEWVDANAEKKIVVKEAAIMFESGAWKDMDFIAVVVAPEACRIARVLKRDSKNEKQIKAIIDQQLPEAELIKRADFVVVNNDHQLVMPQILSLIEELENRISAK